MTALMDWRGTRRAGRPTAMRAVLAWGVLAPLAAWALVWAALALDPGAAALRYGSTHDRRRVMWRAPDPHDGARFPSHPIAPAAFLPDPAGPEAVEAAVGRVVPSQ